jgi:hypothetical protein
MENDCTQGVWVMGIHLTTPDERMYERADIAQLYSRKKRWRSEIGDSDIVHTLKTFRSGVEMTRTCLKKISPLQSCQSESLATATFKFNIT